MKHLLLITIVFFMTMGVSAQESKIDETATLILDRMSDFIGDLTSASYTLNSSRDTAEPDLGLIKHFNKSDVYLSGAGKMLVDTRGDKMHRGYWYNGSQLAYYNYTENNFGIIDAPKTTIETIDLVNRDYGIDFPAADFLYPTFTDDLIANSEIMSYLGVVNINGKECFHIAAHGKKMDIQLWIANDATNLPVKYVIVYNDDKENVGQFEGEFSNWVINPNLPNGMFEFTTPPAANKLILVAKSKK